MKKIMADIFVSIDGNEKRMRFLRSNPFYKAARSHRLSNNSFYCHKELNSITGKWEGNCVICDKYSQFWGFIDKKQVPYHYSGNLDAFMGDVRGIKPVERYYYNVIDRDNEEMPLVFPCGKTVHEIILQSMLNPVMQDATNFFNGRDFVVRKEMKADSYGYGGFPDYSKSGFLEKPSSAGTRRQIEFWMNNLHDLNARVILKPKEEMHQALINQFGDFDTPEKKKILKIKAINRDINEPFESSFYA